MANGDFAQLSGLQLLSLQLRANLKRHVLDKLRHYRTTICEILVPVLIVWFMAIGYALSEVTTESAENYADIVLDIPGALGELYELVPRPAWDPKYYCAGDSLCGDGTGRGIWEAETNAEFVVDTDENGELVIRLPEDTEISGNYITSGYNETCVANNVDDLDFTCRNFWLESLNDDGGGSGSGSSGGLVGDVSIGDLTTLLDAFDDVLTGPLPFPTFDQFVAIGLAVTNALDVEEYEELINSNSYGRQFGNIFTLGEIHLTGADAVVSNFVHYMENNTLLWNEITHRVHRSESAALDYVMDNLEDRTWAIIVFDEFEEGRVDYTIRMNYTTLPNTNFVVNFVSIGLDTSYQRYYLSGFLTLQQVINDFAFEYTLEVADCDAPLALGTPFPTAEYDQNTFYLAAQFLLGFGLSLATVYPVSKLLGALVEERETRMRETLLILGLRELVLNLGWLIIYAAWFSLIAFVMSLIMISSFTGASDPVLILIWVWLFLMSELALCFLLSTLFVKAKVASLFGSLAVFALTLPRYAYLNTTRYEATTEKQWVSLLSPSAFAFGAEVVLDYEYAEIGVSFDNYTEGDYSFLTSLQFMAVDTILYFALAFYLDKVMPREYGTQLPLGFIFNPFYWFPWLRCAVLRPKRREEELSLLRTTPADSAAVDVENADEAKGAEHPLDVSFRDSAGNFEPPPEALIGMEKVSVRHLVKAYGQLSHKWGFLAERSVSGTLRSLLGMIRSCGSSKEHEDASRVQPAAVRKERSTVGRNRAVDDLSFDLYEGQITCLLGHNGAGKSTTIGILTGLFPPTAGSVDIYGMCVSRDPFHGFREVRQQMGICPQHSVLYDELTVREHLELIAAYKGIPIVAVRGVTVVRPRARASREAAEEVGLGEKYHTRAKNLSGGMKRKLSVAMALLGDPRFVLLDEPSSGMDPHSRRSIWELLKRKRQGRVILLTTHFMDEADVLGDRILIMSKGQLQCSGSPLFLKMRFGIGYNLTVTCRPGARGMMAKVVNLLAERFDIAPFQEHGGEIAFRLPSVYSSGFPALFKTLEKLRTSGEGLVAFGVSITTLEEVFLRLAELDGRAADADADADPDEDMPGTTQGPPRALAVEAIDSGHGVDIGVGAGAGAEIELAEVELPHVNNANARPPAVPATVEAAQLEEASSATARGAVTAAGDHLVRPVAAEDPSSAAQASCCAHERKDECGEEGHGKKVAPATEAGRVRAKRDKVFLGARKASSTPLWRQIVEVIRKRSIIASRDPSALLFQVLTPIALVGLSLLVLTLQPRLAGPSLTLSMSMFEEDTLIHFSEGEDAKNTSVLSDIVNGRYPGRYDVNGKADFDRQENSSDSFELSEFLLDTYSTVGRNNRFGAYVFDDTLRFEITVDWPQIDSNLSAYLETAAYYGLEEGGAIGVVQIGDLPFDVDTVTVGDLLDAIGDGTYELGGANVTITDGTANGTVEINGEVVEFAITDENALIVDGTTITNENGTLTVENGAALVDTIVDEDTVFGVPLNQSLDEALEESEEIATFLDIFNLTVSDIEDAAGVDAGEGTVQDIVDVLNVTGLVTLDGAELQEIVIDLDELTVFIDLKSFTWEDPVFFVEGVQIRVGDSAFEVGALEIRVDDITEATPDEVETYNFTAPWPLTVLHNASGLHALPAFYNQIVDLEYQTCLIDEDRDSVYEFYLARNHPLPLTAQQSLEIQTLLSIFAALFIQIPMCYAPAAFVVSFVKERIVKAKHLQLVSGLSPHGYWLASYLFDSFRFLVITAGVMLTFSFYGEDAAQSFWEDDDSKSVVFLIIFLYGLAVVPLNYIYSRHFHSPTTANISIASINFFTGFVFLLSIQVMLGIESTADAASQAVHFCRAFPPFLLGEALIAISVNYFERQILGVEETVWDWGVGGRAMTFLALEAAGYLALLLLLESDVAQSVSSRIGKAYLRFLEWSLKEDALDEDDAVDSDVREEAAAAAAADPATQSVLLRNLHKSYPGPLLAVLREQLATLCCRSKVVDQERRIAILKRAVRGVSFSVQRGEVFGLLGVNGAGKSSTLGVLTGDLVKTDGDVFVAGHDVSNFSEVRKLVGYCPQVDPLFDLMTARETLLFYGRIKGLEAEELLAAVQSILDFLGLTHYADMVSKNYSGGNKRKLSLGIALIGGPSVCFVDEASTGLDPGARRAMWNCIETLGKTMTVILTSHSMEEVEALCTRVGILRDGKLRCFGTVQLLKDRHLNAFHVECRINEEMQDELRTFCSDHGWDIVEMHGSHCDMSVKGRDATLGDIFQLLEDNKTRLAIAEYSVSQGTLEDVFLRFAK